MPTSFVALLIVKGPRNRPSGMVWKESQAAPARGERARTATAAAPERAARLRLMLMEDLR